MDEIDSLIDMLDSLTVTSWLDGIGETNSKKAQDHKQYDSVPVIVLYFFSRIHFTQPSYSKLQFL